MANRPKSGGKPPFDRLIAGIPEESLERSLGHVNPESPTTLQLDSVVSLVVINAKCSPQSLGENLGFSPIVIDDIVSDYSGDKIQQREGVIHRWIEVNGKRATLKKLLEALYHCDETQSIRLVKDELTVQEAIATDRRAPTTAAFVTPVQSQIDSMVPSFTLLQKNFEKQHSTVDSLGVLNVQPHQKPIQLVFEETRPPKRALSTPGSDSDGSLPPVGLKLSVTETNREGHSVLLPGGVFARSSGNGLQEQHTQPDAFADMQKEMSQMKEKQERQESDMKVVLEGLTSLRLETQQKFSQLQEESKTLTKELKARDKKIEELTSQMAEMRKSLTEELQKEQKKLQVTEEKLQESTADNAALQQKIRMLETTLAKERDEKREVENRLQEVQVELKNSKEAVDIPDTGATVPSDMQPQGDTLPANWTHVAKVSLGKGSFGEVFLCDDVVMGRQLAVKVIAIIKGEESRTLREVHALKVLRHERIVPFYGARTVEISYEHGKKTTYLYIFMGYMPGGSLKSYLKSYLEANTKPIPEEDARRFTVQLVEGVKFLHENNIVHRDIKCANILMDSSGNIRLADFGCSKDLEGISGKKSCDAGTPHFLAPESIRGEHHNFKSDIWSVGATVIEMLTGHPPYHDISPTPVILSVGTGKLTPLVDDRFSREAKAFLEQCFKSDHTERPTAEQLLCTPFCQFSPLLGV